MSRPTSVDGELLSSGCYTCTLASTRHIIASQDGCLYRNVSSIRVGGKGECGGRGGEGAKRGGSGKQDPLIFKQHRLAEAIDTAAQALALYGLSLPMDPEQQERAFLADIELIDKNLEKFNNLSELLDLPECVDVVQRNIIKLYVDFHPSP